MSIYLPRLLFAPILSTVHVLKEQELSNIYPALHTMDDIMASFAHLGCYCRESLLTSLSTEVSIVAYKANPGTPNRVLLHVTCYIIT